MNRHDRRAARRAEIDHEAALLARSCIDYGPGSNRPARDVVNPLAVRVLERGFAHLLRRKYGRHVLQVTEAEAAAFPHVKRPHWRGWGWYLAVGIDRTGRAAYVLRPAKVEGASPPQARRMIEAALYAELQPVLEDTSR